jgi:alpha-1,2-mannosyltransferase
MATHVPSAGLNVPTAQQLRFRSKPQPAPGTTKLQPGPNARALRPEEPGLLKDPNLRFTFGRFNPTLMTAFRFLLLVRWASAMYMAIGDCDEGACQFFRS